MSNVSSLCYSMDKRLRTSRVTFAVAIVFMVGLLAITLPAQTKSASSGKSAENTPEVARGKYLVESVAMCGQCHTPRDSSGNLDRSRWLQGASVPWVPAQPQPNWPLMAPRIGGTPPANDADMIKLLTTGIWTTGKPLRLPMMPFRMSEADAKSVVAYLKAATPQN